MKSAISVMHSDDATRLKTFIWLRIQQKLLYLHPPMTAVINELIWA
jgi:hypothetical protein